MSEEICEGFSVTGDNFTCDSCDFKNQSKMGMKRHISIQHKETHSSMSKKRVRVECNDDSSLDGKKTKVSGDDDDDSKLVDDENPAQDSESLDSIMAKAMQYEYNNEIQSETMKEFSFSEFPPESLNLLFDENQESTEEDEKLREMKTKVSDLEQEISNYSIIIDEKNRDIHNANTEVLLLKQEAKENKEALASKDETIQVVLSEKNELEEQFSIKKNEMEEQFIMKDKQVSDVERCLKALNKEFEKLKAENNKLKAAVNLKSSENVAKLTEERKSLLKKISELENNKSIKTIKSKIDELQNEVNRLKTGNREMQLKLAESINKNAQLETQNARTMLQNKNLSELVNKTSSKSCEAMEVDNKDEEAEGTKPKPPVVASKPKKVKKKCKFFERGTCRKGEECPFLHPAGVCVLFSRLGEGACPDGDSCLKSHPTQICEQWVQGNCPRHNKCRLQHPQESLKQNSRSPKQPRKGSDGGGNQTQRRGSQNREDSKPSFVQHQVYEQAQLYSPPVHHQQAPPVHQQAPPVHQQANQFQYAHPPPPQNVNFVRAPLASLLDPGQLALNGLQALLQQQAGAGHPVYPQHPQPGAPQAGGPPYPGLWN